MAANEFVEGDFSINFTITAELIIGGKRDAMLG